MMMACNPVAKRPLLNIVMNNSFIDSSINNFSVTNNATVNDLGILNQANGSRDFGTESQNRSLTINQQAGKDLVSAFKSIQGGTLCVWGKLGTNSGTNVSLLTNLWGFATNTWAFQIYLYKNSSTSSASVNFRNASNTSGFGSSGGTITENLNVWQLTTLRVNGDGGTNTFWKFNIGTQELYNTSTADTIQLPGTTEYIIGRRTDSPANQNMNGDLSNYRNYDFYLSDGQFKILNSQKGRITA